VLQEPPDFGRIVKALSQANVKFIVVGGLAMVSHGSAYITRDLDVCYDRSAGNLDAIARALAPLAPRLRGAPADLPFKCDAATLKAGLNFTLATEAGDLDLLGELSGVGRYDDLLPGSVPMPLFGHPVRVMGLGDLIRSKEAAGRAKDKLHLQELREIRRRQSGR
jgi:hypothetical protein